MKKLSSAILATVLIALCSSAFALKPEYTTPVFQLTSENPGQILSGSKRVFDQGITDPEVLDIIMEVILQNANKGDSFVESLSWACNAISKSGNSRYYTALMSVAEDKGVHKKLRKYAKKAAGKVGKPKGTEQYAKGMADLAKAKKSAEAAQAELAKSIKGAKGFSSIGDVVPGISASELVAKCGPPTSTTSHITGKQFIPFNFKGNDTIRTYYLYKGQGRVVVANDSAYTSNAHVIEIEIDPSEAGYR